MGYQDEFSMFIVSDVRKYYGEAGIAEFEKLEKIEDGGCSGLSQIGNVEFFWIHETERGSAYYYSRDISDLLQRIIDDERVGQCVFNLA